MISAFERRAAWLALVALALSASPAAAEPARDESELDSHTRTAARSLAAQGSAAFEAQRYGEALDLFDRAAALVDAPTIALMQARTLVQLGRWVEAADRYAWIQRWKDANRSVIEANPSFALAVQSAPQELALLMPRIPKLNVSIGVSGPNDEVELHIDARKLPSALIGVDVPVDPGMHEIEVRRPDGAPIIRRVSVGEGTREEVTILLETPVPHAPRVPASVESTPVVESDTSGGSSRGTLGFVLLSAGAAATITGAITGIVALGKKSELDDVCRPGCPPSHAGTIDSYRSNRTVSYVAFAVGVAGLSGGAYLLLSGTRDEPEVALGVTPAGANLWGTF